uniref:Uncharacterized protein n=1 Tax=Fagus sylvatica TaxID=28930 RepID=A0A2N9I7X3_FAGSY
MSSLGSSAASSSPWIPRPYLHPSKFHKFQSCPPPSCFRVVCGGGGGGGVSAEGSNSHHHHVARDVSFVLHDALESSGILASHAREGREGFCAQIRKFSDIERETSICINSCVDLGKTALYIAAEDDSLVSHSSVPLPVDAFVERLDDLSVGYCSHYDSSYISSPEKFLESVERYLYGTKVEFFHLHIQS